MDVTLRRTLYARLLRGYHSLSEGMAVEERWAWLMAAHVVGQPDLRLHWNSHVRMLALACRTRDWPEAGGQLLRLALVPVGHALGKLPDGNVGRATVNPFKDMAPSPEVKRLVDWAIWEGAEETGPMGLDS